MIQSSVGAASGFGRFANEAFGMSQVGGIQNGAALFDGGGCKTIMNDSRREKAQSGMTMLFVVPGEKLL